MTYTGMSHTQAVIVDAVWNHPDQPQTVRTGIWSCYLATECQKHSELQAKLERSGHHNWSARFQEYLQEFNNKYLFSEVAAVTWEWNTELLDAAKDCVDSWRKSPGHWRDIMAPSDLYAFDIQQGASEKWYATGLFGRKRT